MNTIIHEAGGFVVPVLLFGAAAIIMAARQFWAPEAPRRLTTLWLVGLTVVSGAFATAVGLQASVRHVTRTGAEDGTVFLVGLYESLHNLTLALVLAAVAMLGLLAAHLRNGPQRDAPMPAE
ncbi:MAG: hypothetical protein AAF928_05300 [Myxococcota bacterium]